MSSGRFRINLFWSLIMIVATAYAIRWAVEYIRPVVPFLVISLVMATAAWLAFALWRRRQGYY